MGYHVKIAELHNTSEQMIRQTDRWLRQLGKVRRSLAALAGTTAMSGAGADAMRAYIREVHIQALDWIVNTIETFRSSLILYVNGYEEIEPNPQGEISQDVLEEQLQQLQMDKMEFEQMGERIEQICRELHQYMDIEGVPTADVEVCYDNAIRQVEETRTRVGEYEEVHSHDLNTAEEMIQHINGFLDQHTNAQITDITAYCPGASAKTPEYQKARQLSVLHQNYVTMVSDTVKAAVTNRGWKAAPVIIDATGGNAVTTGNCVRLKYVAARGAFFKETATGAPVIKGNGLCKLQECVNSIRLRNKESNLYAGIFSQCSKLCEQAEKATAKLAPGTGKMGEYGMALLKQYEDLGEEYKVYDNGELVAILSRDVEGEGNITYGYGTLFKNTPEERNRLKEEYGLEYGEKISVTIPLCEKMCQDYINQNLSSLHEFLRENNIYLNQYQMDALIMHRYLTYRLGDETKKVLIEISKDSCVNDQNIKILYWDRMHNAMLDDLKMTQNYEENKVGWENRILDELELFFDGDTQRNH